MYVFTGGGIGSVSRYLAQIAASEKLSSTLFPSPWGTFAVNTAGSSLIGLSYSLSECLDLSFELRLFLTVGFCGGFTTFSALANGGLSLLREGFYGIFASYTLASMILGLLVVLGGGYLGEHLKQQTNI